MCVQKPSLLNALRTGPMLRCPRVWTVHYSTQIICLQFLRLDLILPMAQYNHAYPGPSLHGLTLSMSSAFCELLPGSAYDLALRSSQAPANLELSKLLYFSLHVHHSRNSTCSNAAPPTRSQFSTWPGSNDSRLSVRKKESLGSEVGE